MQFQYEFEQDAGLNAIRKLRIGSETSVFSMFVHVCNLGLVEHQTLETTQSAFECIFERFVRCCHNNPL